ncbi:cAMP-binding domain of CRP or a regulatory subunit of cAMP-dependent protein kinases [Azotobacter beijerinckii]|uniref:cAMP-binding domain of CRP or a regulatory subunit of cAMP-dependent protein kinases n=1 Tax=Azotobacter beijerinckii TaxID=170623 RepID=A0A1H9HWA5_9GAMM|nr:Crp/Fnr family transcriptional regulator [Azotobacter beijerinckii]SEQ66606.1 cAMP-binding domain of CRP or a regulatory subunit of cAMP-dependent protein kinases [Azotobacter beijerinckii]
MNGPDPSNLLERLDALTQAALLQGFHQRQLVEDELLGSPSGERDSVFIVRSGRIRVFLALEDKEYTLTFLEAGDIYSTHSQAYVQTVRPSEVLMGDTARMMATLRSLPSAVPAIIRVLGATLANCMGIIEDLAFRDVEGRLARFLDGMLARRGRPHQGSLRLELDLNTEDIARLLGTTRQTVSSLINRMAREGILSRAGNGIFDIHDAERLRARSQQPGKVSAG